MRTSFHHQPEAQHPKSLAINKLAGRLPHLWVISDILAMSALGPLYPDSGHHSGHGLRSAMCHLATYRAGTNCREQ